MSKGGFPIATLGEVGTFQAGARFPPRLQGRSGGVFPFAKVGDISRAARSGTLLNGAENYVNPAELSELKAVPLPAGSIVFAKTGETIRRNYRVITAQAVLIDNNLMGLIPHAARVTSRYLFHFLCQLDFGQLAEQTTVPSIRKSRLAQVPIPLPPLPEQRRIADVLDRAEALRSHRRATLGELSALAESIFTELFTGPSAQGFTTTRLSRVGDAQGGLPVSAARSHLPCEVPYLRVANVYRNVLDLSEIKSIRATDSEVARTRLHPGDLLLVEGHGDPGELGRCALWDGSSPVCVHQNHLIRVRLDPAQVHPVFVSYYLNSAQGRQGLRRAAKTTSGLNTLSVASVRDAEVPIPPLALQREFASRVAVIDKLSSAHRASLRQLDELFAALRHRAFRGELWPGQPLAATPH